MRLNEIISEVEVDSSWMHDIEHNEETNNVTMQTASGMVYIIQNVPVEIYTAWLAAPSKGAFFHANIKNTYDIEKV